MIPSPLIQILLVDDHAIVSEGYKSLLEKQPSLKIVAIAKDGETAYSLYKELTPDLVIMDLSLPGQGGLATIAQIRQFNSKAKVLVFSMHQNPALALKSTQAGASGYVTKSSLPDVLIRAIYDVHKGKIALSPDIAQSLAMEQLGGDSAALAELTVREFEILRMLVEATSTEVIAQTLHISPKTVSNCHYIIKRKLGVANDIELTRLAIKMNLLNPLDLSIYSA